MTHSSARMEHPDEHGTQVRADPAVEQLLRQLIRRVGDDEEAHAAHVARGDDAEVVLDLRVDGRSYTLLRRSGSASRAHVSLSPREKEIVRLVAKGLPSKAIAAVLDVSSWTVATHLRRVFAKLDVGTRAEMVARVLEEGLLGEAEPPPL